MALRKTICGIYSVTNPTGKIYIGQSRNVTKRWVDYKSIQKSNDGQPKLYNSFIKYGVENHEFKLIEECELDQLNIRERYWQDFYDCGKEAWLASCGRFKQSTFRGQLNGEQKRKTSFRYV